MCRRGYAWVFTRVRVSDRSRKGGTFIVAVEDEEYVAWLPYDGFQHDSRGCVAVGLQGELIR
jgi:hypothetical protein